MRAAIVQRERCDCVIRKFESIQSASPAREVRLGMVYDFDNGRRKATETYRRH